MVANFDLEKNGFQIPRSGMIRFFALLLTAIAPLISGCGGGSSDSSSSKCPETGPYACATGATEPLYLYQWALNSAKSFFTAFPNVSDGTTDIDVESVHAQGIKGEGVRVFVMDNGMEINHIDLKANVDPTMTWNYETNNSDPLPPKNEAFHGTAVAGIIAAPQNGIGIMGVAPKATIGGVRFVGAGKSYIEAYGGAPWSRNLDVINASIDRNNLTPDNYDPTWGENIALQNLPNLRNGKGAILVQAGGNHYLTSYRDWCPTINNDGSPYSVIGCGNSGYDSPKLELTVVATGAVNAKGVKASYSNSGSNLWVVAPGGESISLGNYGEYGSSANEYGPAIFSLDFMGCIRGKSRRYITPNILDYLIGFLVEGSQPNSKSNSECNYGIINATSAATPHVSGVIALMLSINPNLGWRDIREILRVTSKKIDPEYGSRSGRDNQVRLDTTPGATSISPTLNGSTNPALVDGSSAARIDYGWVKNAAGYQYSNWYGWGLINAKAAVDMAKSYSSYKPAQLNVPPFSNGLNNAPVEYGRVRLLGSFNINTADRVDQIQFLFNASQSSPNPICMGSVGLYVKSPSGTISILQTPYNIYYNTQFDHDGGQIDAHSDFSLASYAFYGEQARGTWEVYAVSGLPLTSNSACGNSGLLDISYRVYPAY